MAAILTAILAMSAYGFVSWYVGQINVLTKSADKASDARVAKIKKLADAATAKKSAQVMTTMIGAPIGPQPGSNSGATALSESRTIAPETAQIGDMVVGISNPRLGPLNQSTAGDCLSLTLRITNLSKKPMTYHSWSRPKASVILRDQNRNYYNRIDSSTQGDVLIDPGVTITDTLQFERPLATAAVLDLDLPTGGRPYQFRIPVAIIQRAPTSVVSVAKEQAGDPAAPPAYDPEKDPQLIADVKAVYGTAMQKMESRTLGMTTNNAARFRTTEPKRVVKTLAERLKLTTEQIKRMLSAK